MPWDTFAEIRTDVLDRAGKNPTDTTDDYYATAQRQIDRAYHEILNAHAFLFLRVSPPGVFRTIAPLTTGTLSVTNGAAAVTFSSAPAPSLLNRELIVGGWNEVYRISAHTAGAVGATLDSVFNGTTRATATYTVLVREFALATDLRHIIELVISDGGVVMEQRDEAWLREQSPDPPSALWPPRYFARIGDQRIRLQGYPDRTRRVEYAYTQIPQTDLVDGGTILIPRGFRHVIADGALYWTYVVLNDDRADSAGILYAAGQEALIADDLRRRMTLGRHGVRGSGVYA